MKLNQYNNEDVTTIGDKRGRQATISTSSGHIFKLLAGQYKDSYGAVVRELTSNCYDAHKESNTNYPVKVGFKEDSNGNEFVFFRDYGNGMSPEFMDNTYMSYGESTKQDDIDALGFFGIGSKSPLSIKDQFEIISIIKGIKYHYTIFYNEKDIPDYDIISTTETNEENGTEVRIFLDMDSLDYNNVPYEKGKFIEAFKKHLFYFTEVFYHDVNDKELNTNYTLYEFNNFVFRKGEENKKTDIYYKRVKYPIDYNLLHVDEFYSEGIGLKFNLGDLEPTPPREDIKYNRREINALLKKIKGTCHEIISRYNSSQDFITDNVNKYRELYGKAIYKEEEYEINVNKIHQYLEDNFEIDFPVKKIKFKLFEELGITKYNPSDIITILSLCFKIYGSINNTRLYTAENRISSKSMILKNLLDENHRPIFTINPKTFKSNKLKNKFIESGDLISSNKNLREFIACLDEGLFERNKIINFRLRKAAIIRKYFVNIILNNTSSYKKLEIPKEDLEILQKREEVIKITESFVYNMRGSRYSNNYLTRLKHNSYESFKSNYIKKKYTILYCYQKELTKALMRLEFFGQENSPIKVILVAKRNYKLLQQENLPNFMSQEQFFERKMFRNICTAFYLQEILNEDEKETYRNIDDDNFISEINDKVFKRKEEIESFIRRYNSIFTYSHRYSEEFEEFKEDCLQIGLTNNLIDTSMVKSIKNIKSYFKGLDLLPYINYKKVNNIIAYQHVINYVKITKKRVNKKWYNILQNKWELQLIEESYTKINYLNSLKQIL